MTTITHKGYTAEYQKDFNVPAGWPPRFRINRIIRADGSIIFSDTYTGVGVSASFRSQLSNKRAVEQKLQTVVEWDMMTTTERATYLAADDIPLF